MESQYSYVENATIALNFYFSAAILPFGMIFNGLSSLIFNRQRLNKTTMGFLYGHLTVIDSISLLTGLVLVQFLPSLNINVMFESNVVCKLGQFTLRVVQNLSSWIQVLISLDRYLNVCHPNRFLAMRKRKTLALIMLGTTLFVLAINVENLFFYVTRRQVFVVDLNTTFVVKRCTADPAITFASDLITAFMRTWIPFCVMAFFSWRTTRQLWLSKKRILRTDSLKRERQFSLTVMLFNVLFFSFNAPVSISLILTNVYKYFPALTTPEAIQALELFKSISFSFSYFYQSITFFVNFLFNKIFRQEVQQIVSSLKKRMQISDCEMVRAPKKTAIINNNKKTAEKY